MRNIFPSLWFIFYSLNIFWIAKVLPLPLIKSNLSICSFMDYAFGVVSKKYVVTIIGLIFRKAKITKFSLRNFICLGFVFRSVIHFLLIFESKFIHLHMDIQLFQHHLLKSLHFLPWNCLSTFVKTQITIYVSSFFIVFHWYSSPPIFIPLLQYLDYYKFITNCEVS